MKSIISILVHVLVLTMINAFALAGETEHQFDEKGSALNYSAASPIVMSECEPGKVCKEVIWQNDEVYENEDDNEILVEQRKNEQDGDK